MRQFLPAAVIPADAPHAANVASTVPVAAKIIKFGGAIVGYEKVPTAVSATPVRQRFTLLEMRGRHYRKMLRALVRARRSEGVVIEDLGAWALVAADIAAAIFGPGMTIKNVEGQCQFMGVDVDPTTLGPIAERAAQWRRAPNYRPLSGEDVGKLVKLSWRERDVLGKCQIGSFDETRSERRKRLDRGRKAAERAQARAARIQSPWEQLGISKSTYYRRRETNSVRIPIKEGKADKISLTPGKADGDSLTLNPLNEVQPTVMGKADKISLTSIESDK